MTIAPSARTEPRHRIGRFIYRSVQSVTRWTLEPPPTFVPPPLALRVGVTGHLRIENPAALRVLAENVLRRIGCALERLEAPYARAAGSPINMRPAPILLSSFAAGADQIVSRAGLQKGFSLQAVLPAGRTAFMEDIRANCGSVRAETAEQDASAAAQEFRNLLTETQGRILELSEVTRLERENYEAAGRTILANSDILLAVMDESASSGITATLVRLALDFRVPVVWLPADAAGDAEIWQLAADRSTELRQPFGEGIEALVEKLVMEGAELPPDHVPLLDLLADWYETGYVRSLEVAYNAREWDKSWPPAEQFPSESEKTTDSCRIVEEIFKPLALWSDRQAAAYAGMYRGAFALNALMGVLAVATALMGVVFPPAAIYGKCLELVLLLSMSAVFLVAHRRHWREKWLNWRALYQDTHHAAWRFLLGRVTLRHPEYNFGDGTIRGNARFLLSAATRAAGIPKGDAGESCLNSLRKCILAGLVQRQREYFSSESRTNKGLHKRFEERVERCVLLALLSTAAYLTAKLTLWALGLSEHLHDLLIIAGSIATFAGAVFPACAAALVAVSTFEEHGQLASRYGEMQLILKRIRDAMAGLDSPKDIPSYSPRGITREVLAALLDSTIETADEELVHWQLILAYKKVDRF